ncbi:MAG: nucleotidyltransferase domain-containing protein [Solirubrobacterales bacterium]
MAAELGVSDRTLRRAVGEGLLRGEHSGRRIALDAREELYARHFWPLLGKLRAALRTEAGVACAVIFGSAARGELAHGSDIDVLVRFRHDELWKRVGLQARLANATGRDVQIVELAEAERAPILLDEILRDGRPLVDRDGTWKALRALRDEIAGTAAEQERKLASRARRELDEFLAKR